MLSSVNNILVISLSNIGDVILTFPVIDTLLETFPSAKLSLVIGPKARPLVEGNTHICRLYIFEKRQTLGATLSWLYELRKGKFDLVIDLRNTAIPLFLWPYFGTSFFLAKWRNGHMREKHFQRLKKVLPHVCPAQGQYALQISPTDKGYVEQLLTQNVGASPFVVVGAGAADHAKRWTEEGFGRVCEALQENYGMKIIFVGDETDQAVSSRVIQKMRQPGINFCGRTSLTQLAHLMKKARLVIVNDSAPMHLASYLNVPVLALFGPTNPLRYGPWSSRSVFIRRSELCSACAQPQSIHPHTCMQAITPEMVLEKIKAVV